MTDIRLWNTRTKRKETLQPVHPGRVGMYVCGPTVYDRAHLGNARPVVVFDVLYRLLRHVYGEGNVTYVRNFTDVDDKINARAAEAGRPIREITDETIGWYHQDMDALGALRPTHEPRATDMIGPMVAMIERLVAKGHAYAVEGHVLFRVRSYAQYGALSGRSVDDMIAGARVEVTPYKEDPLDFVLWKPSNATQPGWDSPWGRGRPGWHIECSAMARELLGGAFDIHGGGIDLQFPHHENEIAQSVCAHPEEAFASIWMHNEMLLVEGKKMSKSLGNFFTVRDLLKNDLLKNKVRGEVIRFMLLGTHYSKPMDWTEERVNEATISISRWEEASRGLDTSSLVEDKLISILADDLDTPGAITFLHTLYKQGMYSELAACAKFLGLELQNLNETVTSETDETYNFAPLAVTEPEVRTPQSVKDRADQARLKLLDLYNEARKSKDFSNVDKVKQLLLSSGIKVGFSTDNIMIDSIDVEMARAFVFRSLPKWADRAHVFDTAIVKMSSNSFLLSKQALALYYFSQKVDEVCLEIVI